MFSLWPSKGLVRTAFEVKVSRSDFIRELQNPSKHKWVRESFHEFWIAAPKDIVNLDELPDGVGLMSPHAGKLGIRKHCKRNESPNLDDHLLAAFMRSAAKEIERTQKQSEATTLETSKAHKTAMSYQHAVKAFCEKRGSRIFDTDAEGIIRHLEEATADKEVKEDIDQLVAIGEKFQWEIVGLFSAFAVIANKALLARDEMGKLILQRFDFSTPALEILKERTKPHYEKRYAELLGIILNWQKEFGCEGDKNHA